MLSVVFNTAVVQSAVSSGRTLYEAFWRNQGHACKLDFHGDDRKQTTIEVPALPKASQFSLKSIRVHRMLLHICMSDIE